MNSNCDTYIKQEFLNAEEKLIHSLPGIDLNIPIKNEPILDESYPPVSIKNEPLSEETFMEGDVTVKTENPLQTETGDSFIIYELETSAVSHKQSTPSQQIETHISKGIPSLELQNHNSNINQTKQILINKKPVAANINQAHTRNIINHSTPPRLAASPPILLNSQLRKRHKVVLPVNPIDKRTRYNIEGTTTPPPPPLDTNYPNSDSLNSTETPKQYNLLSNVCKKIINHIIKHKTNQRKHEENVALRESTPIPRNSSNEDTRHTIVSTSRKQNMSSVSGENLSQITANPETELNLITNSLNTRTVPLSTTENSLNLSKESCDTPIIPEIRVKCLCSLTDDTKTSNSDLKSFFMNMFEETRHLNKAQQRKVKMSLLKAISDAEELVEQGKCCCIL